MTFVNEHLNLVPKKYLNDFFVTRDKNCSSVAAKNPKLKF